MKTQLYCSAMFLFVILLTELLECKKVHDCAYDPDKCRKICGVRIGRMPKGFGCRSTLKSCLCPTTVNTKLCRDVNKADKDELFGCNSKLNCPSHRLTPKICEIWDQNKFCGCFRFKDDPNIPRESRPSNEV